MNKIRSLLAVTVLIVGASMVTLTHQPKVYADSSSVTNTTPAAYIMSGWYTYFQLDWRIVCQDTTARENAFRSDWAGAPDGSHVYRFYQGDQTGNAYYTIDNGAYKTYSYLQDCTSGSDSSYTLINTFTLPLDTTNPVLSISSPSDGQHITGNSINVTGSASDSSSGIDFVDVNGYSANLSGSNWTAPIYFSSGFNGSLPITVKTYDNTGHFVTKSLTITVSAPTAGSGSGGGSGTAKTQKPQNSTGSSSASNSAPTSGQNSSSKTSQSSSGTSSSGKLKTKESAYNRHEAIYIASGGVVIFGLSFAQIQWHIFSFALRRLRPF